MKKAQSEAAGTKKGENGEKVEEMVQNAFKMVLWGRKRAKMERKWKKWCKKCSRWSERIKRERAEVER